MNITTHSVMKISMIRNPFIRAAFPLLALAACGRGADASPDRFAVDSAGGVVRVRNPEAGSWTPATAWRATQDLRIGATDGDGPDVLVAPGALEVDAMGRVYVLDVQLAEVRVFDAAGRPVRTFGRRGAGPGEMAQPAGMAWAPDGALWVVDPGNGRYAAFDTAGKFLRTRPRPNSSMTMPWPGRFDRAGRLYDVASVRRGNEQVPALLRLAGDAERADTLPLPAFRADEFRAQPGSQVQVSAPVPYAPRLEWALDDTGRVWSGETGRYRLRVQNERGDTVRVVERAHTPVPVSAAERDSVPLALKWFTDQGGKVDLGRVPSEKPAFRSIRFDDRGYAWVRPWTPAGAAETAFDVFQPDGRYLGRVTLPIAIPDEFPVVIRGERLYAVTITAEGTPQVVGYRLEGRAARS
jgi:hypothetical protein